VIILVLASVIYKNEKSPTPHVRFPVSQEETKRGTVDVPLYLYVFFSKQNCSDCLESIEALNYLPSQYVVTGIVPEMELKNDEMGLRRMTGATFPLISASAYKKHIPWYTPCIIGVSPKGVVIFELPGVPGEKEYLVKYLDSLYEKIYPIFFKEKVSRGK
jgi:hypothetical protein